MRCWILVFYCELRAKDYYDPYYTNYDSNMPLSFNGEKPDHPIPANKISSDGEGFSVHLVCIRENGTYISPRTMQYVSRIIKKEISPKFDFHSLRVTHATMLKEMGVDDIYIQTRLGHTIIKMTMKYERTSETMRNRGRAALNSLYAA